VKLSDIAVVGGPSPGGLRLELLGQPGSSGLELELLHDDRSTGTFARVFAGSVGRSDLSLPVAFKLQRDASLNLEQRSSARAKMDRERGVHRRLQKALPSDAPGLRHLVRQFEIWAGPLDEADSLPPCILCAHAIHGLAPRCPNAACRGARLVEQEDRDLGALLKCERCGGRYFFSQQERRRIRLATVQRDEACGECQHRHDPEQRECQRASTFISFYCNRALLLERLDLDLEDYLNWSQASVSVLPANRPAAVRAFKRHQEARSEAVRWPEEGPCSAAERCTLERLAGVVEVFAAILEGIRFLHHHKVAHLDLKPANVCVRFRGAELEVKLIDLGLSDDAAALGVLRQAAGPLQLGTDFTAPEFQRLARQPEQVRCRFRQDRHCEMVWKGNRAGEIRPGDRLFFSVGGEDGYAYRAVWVAQQHDALHVHARIEGPGAAWDGRIEPLPALSSPADLQDCVLAEIEPHCGYPADVFSLGMVLLALLTGKQHGRCVRDYRTLLDPLRKHLAQHASQLGPLPARALVHKVLEPGASQTFLGDFRTKIYAVAVEGLGQVLPLGEELLGLVLRATIRGDLRLFYQEHRSSDAIAALNRLQTDLEPVRRSLRAAQLTASACLERINRLRALPKMAGGGPLVIRTVRLAYPELDLAAASETALARELAFELNRGPEAEAIVAQWKRELQAAAPPIWAAPLLTLLTRYGRRQEASLAVAEKFLHRAGQDRSRFARWQALVKRLGASREFASLLRRRLGKMHQELFRPWDDGLQVKWLGILKTNYVDLLLPDNAADHFGVPELLTSLEEVKAGHQVTHQRDQDRLAEFDNETARWDEGLAAADWLPGVVALRKQIEAQELRLAKEAESWHVRFTEVAEVLAKFLTNVNQALQQPRDGSGRLRLSRDARERCDDDDAGQAASWLEKNWAGPGDAVEADLILRDVE
jgi:serine/threonine protein kinase